MKSFWVKSRIIIVSCVIFLPLSLMGCAKASSSYDMPPTLDSSARYLFFLHGRNVEKSGPHGEHPRHGAYDYYGILKAFADLGFTVISEIRPMGTNPPDMRRRWPVRLRPCWPLACHPNTSPLRDSPKVVLSPFSFRPGWETRESTSW